MPRSLALAPSRVQTTVSEVPIQYSSDSIGAAMSKSAWDGGCGIEMPTDTCRMFPSTRGCASYPGFCSMVWCGCGHERAGFRRVDIGCQRRPKRQGPARSTIFWHTHHDARPPQGVLGDRPGFLWLRDIHVHEDRFLVMKPLEFLLYLRSSLDFHECTDSCYLAGEHYGRYGPDDQCRAKQHERDEAGVDSHRYPTRRRKVEYLLVLELGAKWRKNSEQKMTCAQLRL